VTATQSLRPHRVPRCLRTLGIMSDTDPAGKGADHLANCVCHPQGQPCSWLRLPSLLCQVHLGQTAPGTWFGDTKARLSCVWPGGGVRALEASSWTR
jgi:hypothetical protein